MKTKRLLALIISTAMLIGMLPSHFVFADGDVAQIGSAKYSTLAEAFDAAQDMTEWNSQPVSRENPVEIDLIDNMELSDTILPTDRISYTEVTYHVRLDGNNHTVKRAEGFKDAMIHVAQSSTLYLENITLDGAVEGNANDSILYIGATGIYQSDSPQKTHDNYVVLGSGAVLQNNHSKNQGGAVQVGAGQFVLDGGSILNNESDKSGGGVYVWTGKEGSNAPAGEEDKFYPSIFTMNSGKISGNKAVSNYTYAGGVFVSSISKDEYENGTNPSGFIMKGGEITDNISYDGAAVTMSNYDNVQILGGTISGNKCENSSGTARTTGVTGILCNYGASIKMGGKVTITDQISLDYYSTSTGDDYGKIIVVDELDTGDNPLPLRINPDKTKYPDGTVLAEKGTGYTGSLNLSDFAWKYDYSGYENTSRMLTMSDDGTQVLAGTLKSPVRKGSLNLEYEYGIKLGELDFSGYEIYDENGENKLEGSWQIT